MSGEQVDLKKALQFFKDNCEDDAEVFKNLLRNNPEMSGEQVDLEKAQIIFGSNLDDPAFLELLAEEMRTSFEEANCDSLLKVSDEIRYRLKKIKLQFAYGILSMGTDYEKLNNLEAELLKNLFDELEKFSLTVDEVLAVISQAKKNKTK